MPVSWQSPVPDRPPNADGPAAILLLALVTVAAVVWSLYYR